MSSTQTAFTSPLSIDQTLLAAAIAGTREGLQMSGVEPRPVGASSLFNATRQMAVMVGLVGSSNGTLTINLSERAMLFLAGKMLFEEQAVVNEECVDAICEIGNMIAGSTKEALEGSEFELTNISVPSLVMGASFDVHYTRGIDLVTVEFELPEIAFAFHRDRFFSTTISLLKRIV